MPFFDHTQRCSFGGFEFPIDSIDVRGGLRDHIHVFPHADGGAPEKLGRKLYEISVSAIFDEGMQLIYPDLYPDTLWKLRILFEGGITDDLVLPNLGTIKAYCRDWPQSWKAAVRSGERATFMFVEDPQVAQLSVFNLNTVPDSQETMFGDLDDFNVRAQQSADRLAAQQQATVPGGVLDVTQCSLINPDLVAQMGSVFGEIAALRGVADLALTRLDQLVASLTSYASQIENTITSPFDYQLLYIMQDMVAASVAFQNNQLASLGTLKTYVVPRRMTAMEIASAVFGDSSRTMDILDLNPITDAFNVPAGTLVNYIDSTAGAGNTAVGAQVNFYQAAASP